MSLSMVMAKPSVSSGSPTDHDHHRRIRLKCPSPIVAERFLDFEAGVAKEEVQFTGKENVAHEVVDITFHGASVLILLVNKSDLCALLVAEIARGFPPNQSCAIAFIDVVDVNLYRCARWDTEGIRERSHIGHRGFDQQPSARLKIL
jgi:hypothetical protein